MYKPFSAYTGEEPFVFVCYAHDDNGVVYPEIAWLHEQGIKIWYDEGISAGKNWRAAIGDALLRSSHVLFYISEYSLKSNHCNREINLALDEEKNVVPVYLEKIELTSDLKVGLSRVQALYRDNEKQYRRDLLDTLGIPGESHVPAISSQNKLRSDQGLTTIAVLPLTDLSGDSENALFSDGMSGEIWNQLSRLKGLGVISMTSSSALKNAQLDVREIGKRLNAEYIVEGNVNRSGDRNRVNVHLIDSSSGTMVWGETYNRTLTDIGEIFELYDDISGEISQALGNFVQRKGPTKSIELSPEAPGSGQSGTVNSAVRIPMKQRGYGIWVGTLIDLSLIDRSRFVLTATSSLTVEELQRRLPTQSKIGTVETIRNLVNSALPGIPIRFLPAPPRQIKHQAGYTYFELDKTSEHWTSVEGSGRFAIHFSGALPDLQIVLWAVHQQSDIW